jgi:hypothetical protein
MPFCAEITCSTIARQVPAESEGYMKVDREIGVRYFAKVLASAPRIVRCIPFYKHNHVIHLEAPLLGAWLAIHKLCWQYEIVY